MGWIIAIRNLDELHLFPNPRRFVTTERRLQQRRDRNPSSAGIYISNEGNQGKLVCIIFPVLVPGPAGFADVV